MQKLEYIPIGIIHSPFKEATGTPIQSATAKKIRGIVEVYGDYVDGLRDLKGFSHIILIYHFHLADKYKLLVKPFLDHRLRGLFATRAPARPNPIGISVVRLVGIEETKLHIENIDIVDGTPLLDIKPYVPTFDETETYRVGWLKNQLHKLSSATGDNRFSLDKNIHGQ